MSQFPTTPAGAGDDSKSEVAKQEAKSVANDASNEAKSVANDASREAKSVANDAKEQTQQVAGHAADQAKEVVQQARVQAMDLFNQSKGEFTAQANTQQNRLAQTLRSLGEELSGMAGASQQQGLAANGASQASDKIHQAASFLEQNDFQGVVDELTGFARRRPGAFLLGAAIVGLAAGRLTRGLTSDAGQGPTTVPARITPAEPVPHYQPEERAQLNPNQGLGDSAWSADRATTTVAGGTSVPAGDHLTEPGMPEDLGVAGENIAGSHGTDDIEGRR